MFSIDLARGEVMTQYFHGQLSGLTIEQKEEIDRSAGCIRDCQQYLDMPDVQAQTDLVRTDQLFSKMYHFRDYFSGIFK